MWWLGCLAIFVVALRVKAVHLTLCPRVIIIGIQIFNLFISQSKYYLIIPKKIYYLINLVIYINFVFLKSFNL